MIDIEKAPNKTISNTSIIYPSLFGIVVALLKWFLPAGIIVAFLVGLGSAGVCFFFCSTTTIENIFIGLGMGSVVVALIYVPVISAKKIAQATTKRNLVFQTLGLTLVGYIILFGITFGWLSISGHKPEGWQPSMNERMLGWVQTKAGEIQDSKRNLVNKADFNNSSFNFVPASSELTFINSNDSYLSVTGTLSGLDKLNGSKSNSQYNIVISEVSVGDMVAQGDVVKRLEGEHFSLSDDLWANTLNVGAGDSQNVTVAATFPKEFVQIIRNNPNTNFKVKIELLALSPYTYQKFNFTPIWSQETGTTPKYMGQFLKDREHGIDYRLPEGAVKFTRIDEKGNFVTESDNQVSFTVTTNPKMS